MLLVISLYTTYARRRQNKKEIPNESKTNEKNERKKRCFTKINSLKYNYQSET